MAAAGAGIHFWCVEGVCVTHLQEVDQFLIREAGATSTVSIFEGCERIHGRVLPGELSGHIYVYNIYPSLSVYQLRKGWGSFIYMPRLFPANKREGEGFIVLMIYSRT